MSVKILHIISYDWGGAAKAAIRLHEGLIQSDVESSILLKWQSQKSIRNSYEFKLQPEKYSLRRKLKNKIKQYKNLLFPQKQEIDYLRNAPEGYHLFTIPNSKFDIAKHPLISKVDIVHLHWVSEFIDYSTFFKKVDKPVVWTMHDMNPFTGGCHHSLECNKYKDDCKNCIQLHGTINPDIAYDIQNLKYDALIPFNKLYLVTPSLWLSECSLQSRILNRFPHKVIPNGTDSEVFKIMNKTFCRELLGLPKDKTILLFVAGDINCKPKGYHLLKAVFAEVCKNTDYALCAVGQFNSNEEKLDNIIELGYINDDRLMSVVYAAADVFVTPSLADNLPNTIVESLMCGTPVIAFPVGGIKQMIINNVNGILCKDIDVESLKDAILFFLENRSIFDSTKIFENAKNTYEIKHVLKQYNDLYKSILEK
ncbi:MAG: glycosyltransferase [Bacteroidales bacterium]|nr:glycosyltransferase [Bacteroidales bacterium]